MTALTAEAEARDVVTQSAEIVPEQSSCFRRGPLLLLTRAALIVSAPAHSVGCVMYTVRVPESVAELLVTEAALAKLGARSISAEEAEQIPRSAHAIVRNPTDVDQPGKRRLLIGRTDGGRVLTLVIEQTLDPTTWLIVTGWSATEVERKIIETSR